VTEEKSLTDGAKSRGRRLTEKPAGAQKRKKKKREKLLLRGKTEGKGMKPPTGNLASFII